MNERGDRQNMQKPRTFMALLLATLAHAGLADAQTTPEQPRAQQESTQSKRRGAFLIPGWGGHRNDFLPLSEILKSQGVVVHIAELPTANAKETGQHEMSKEEFKTAITKLYQQFLHDNSLTSRETTVMGISFGAYLASHLASTENPAQVILRALAVYPDGTLRDHEPMSGVFEAERYAALKRLRAQDSSYDSEVLERLKSYRGHFLCIYGTADTTTPPQMVFRHCSANEQPTIVEVYGGGHTLHSEHQQRVHTFIDAWLQNPSTAVATEPLSKK